MNPIAISCSGGLNQVIWVKPQLTKEEKTYVQAKMTKWKFVKTSLEEI